MTPEYKRLVVCWFKSVIRLDHKCTTDKLKRMKMLYPDLYMVAHNEMFKSSSAKERRQDVSA